MRNQTSSFTIDKRQQLESLAALAATVAPHRLPLIRAARDGVVNLIEPGRTASIPKRIFQDTRRPQIVIIGDDDHAATGPDGWACARRIRYWGKSAIIHATGGKPDHYTLALGAAIIARRFVLIETDSRREAAWEKFLQPQMSVLCIRAPEHAPHPAPPDRMEVN